MTHSDSQPVIRRGTLDDAAVLAQLGAATFAATFGHLYSPEDLQTFLSESHSVAAWARALEDRSRGIWLASFSDGKAIGFISVGACKLPIENRESTAGEIHQLYVLQGHHNLRLGSRLMDLGIQWLDAQHRTPLYIGVWSENFGAQRFYRRYGFHKVGEYGFPVGKTIDRELILKR